ncbi:MAG: FAD-dependent monooxygenase [Rhodobacteraceae bacterium]|nr:FAD-dependent monooxygenase [Paracoccaceae bacterium]
MTIDSTDFDVAIVGSGLVGTSLAAALGNCGFQVVVLERQAPTTRSRDTGRAFALSVASANLVAALSDGNALQEHGQQILEVKVSEGLAGEGARPWTLEFEASELGLANFGYMIEEGRLKSAVDGALDAINSVWRIAPAEAVTIRETPSRIVLSTACGRTFTAKCAVGCDGVGRSLAIGNKMRFHRKSYGQSAVSCCVRHEQPHRGIAHQFFMPTGPIAILPLPADRSSVVWTMDARRAARLGKLANAEFLEQLRPAFGDFLGELSLEGRVASWPLSMSFAYRMCAGRLALAGDAARQLHPLAGQGLNFGFRDVAALAEVLVSARRRGEDIGSPGVLERYQEWRRFDSMTIIAATDAFNWLYSTDDDCRGLIRPIGTSLIGRVPALRRAVLRYAAGMAGDVPKLLRGKALWA